MYGIHMFIIKKKAPLSRYFSLVKEYGEPKVGALVEDPCINGYGIAIFPTGEQFVQDARTGEFIPRDRKVRYLGSQSNLHFYIDDSKPLKKVNQIRFASFPRTA